MAECFHIAHEQDPGAVLLLNEFGFETVDRNGAQPVARQRATLRVLDNLLDAGVPVHALGVQAHLLARDFATTFHPSRYRQFLSEVADRGLKILITELDVLDDGLPPGRCLRDREVAEVYRRYLDVALDEQAVKAVITFGLSDRYGWLEADYPRRDGAARRPLPFSRRMTPKPAHDALSHSMRYAVRRQPLWDAPTNRCAVGSRARA